MATKRIVGILSGGALAVCAVLLLSLSGTAQGQFVTRVKTFTISGSTGEGDVVLKGFPGALIQSDGSGYYSAEVPFGWSGTVTPQKAGFSFEPASHVFEPVKADLTGPDFTPRVQTFWISGTVGMPGVVLDGFPEVVTVDSDGTYRALVSYNWTGTVTPIKDGYEFTPASRPYSVPVTRNYENQTFKAAPVTYELSGTVTVGGVPIAGVVMQGLQGLPGNATTTASGTYSVKVGHRWSGTVTPMKEGYVFDPGARPYSNVDSPMTGQNYEATAIQYTVSGTVGVEGVTLKGLPGNVVSGPDGQYTVSVNHGWSGEVVPALDGFAFDPPKRPYVKVLENLIGQDYEATEVFVTIAGNTGQPGVILEGVQQPDGQSVISDGKGNYSVKLRFGWNGTVTPRKEGYTFRPESLPYNRVVRDMTAQNFAPSRVKCAISGSVGQPQVVLKGFPARVVSSQSGTYQAQVDYDWSGTVTPELGGYEFDPPSITYDAVKEPQLNQDYQARERRFRISGRIASEEGPLDGVMVMTGLGGDLEGTTDYDGNYVLADVSHGWSGVIQLVKEGFEFQPREQRVTAVTRDLVYNFAAKKKMLTITGEIIIDGQPTEGVTVAADNGGTTTVTDRTGKWRVQVPYNWTGSITPTKEGIDFEPPSKPYENVLQDIDETLGAKPIVEPPAPLPTPDRSETPGPARSDPGAPGVLIPPGGATGETFSPEAELRQAQIDQLQKQLDALRAGPVAPGTVPTGRESAVEATPGSPPPVVLEGMPGPSVRVTAIEQDLREVLQDMATQAKVTIVPDAEVTGDISCTTEDVPLEQALDTILAGSGYSWKKTKHYYVVTSAKTESPGFLQGSTTRQVRMSFVNAETAVNMLSVAFRKYVQAEPNGGHLVTITAPSTLMDRIVEDLKELDRRPRMVLLESKVVSLEKSDLLNMGVEWAWPQARFGLFGNDMKGVTGATGLVADYGGKLPWGVQIGYSPDGTFTNALQMALNLLETNGEARIMSNPQVMAQDGKRAEIRVVTEEYFYMTPSFQTQAASLGYISAYGELETVTSGTTLSITPRISDNNDIMLEVAVEMSDSIPKGAGSDLPVVTRRITNNTVIIKDGGTVAVAGLSENKKQLKEKRVPGLGSLPVVGPLFTSTDSSQSNREVAVFITARLVPEFSTMNQNLAGAQRDPAMGRTMMPEISADSDFRSQLQDSLQRRGGR